MSGGFPIICLDCAQTDVVNKITAGLRHSCGGAVDIYLGTPEQQQRVAARAQGGFEEWMHREAERSGEQSSDNSNEYAGPMPGPNPMSNHEGKITCPTCHGSGKDIQDATDPCRECGGDGEVTPTTTPSDPLVYRHDYGTSGPTGDRDRQTKVPFMGQRRSAKGVGKNARAQMLRTVAQTNPGLQKWEVERLVDQTMRAYPEVR